MLFCSLHLCILWLIVVSIIFGGVHAFFLLVSDEFWFSGFVPGLAACSNAQKGCWLE